MENKLEQIVAQNAIRAVAEVHGLDEQIVRERMQQALERLFGTASDPEDFITLVCRAGCTLQ